MRATLFLLPLLLAACTGPIETRVDSAGIASMEAASFAVNPDASGPAAGAQLLVAKLLSDKGYRQSEAAELALQVSVSDRPASLALSSGAQTLSPMARKKRCADRDYRVGITLTRIADGSTFYKASAAEFHCKLTLDQVLGSLVTTALADLGSPRGSYTVKRPR